MIGGPITGGVLLLFVFCYCGFVTAVLLLPLLREQQRILTDCAIIYFSGTGVTHQLASAIRQGAQSHTEGEVTLCRILGEHIGQGRYVNDQQMAVLDNADIIYFGSPTYMGGPAAQFKAFADATSERWESQRWAGKLAAGFTCGSNAGGDQLATLQYFHILASQPVSYTHLTLPTKA